MTSLSRARRAGVTAAGAVAAIGLSACTAGSTTKQSPPPSSTPASTSSTTTPTPAPRTSSVARKAAAPRNPLTGIGPVPTTPVIAVKIDDTAPGRPQVNIDKADIVYIEAVEAGLTRLAAVFGTNKPTVGYVRSTRPSDPDLLLQYGKLTEAYSGGQRVSLGLRRAAGIIGWSNDASAPGFYRAPHANDHGYINVELDLARVAKLTKTNRPHSNGWTFKPALTGLSTAVALRIRTEVTGSYPAGNGTPVEFRWDPRIKKYVRYIDGIAQHAADGAPVSATNVIVQSCRVVPYTADRDVNGNPAQFTYTVGTGRVSVFRQGRRIDGTWSRPKLDGGTTLRTASGAPLPLDPGNTWVVLIRSGIAVRS